MARLVGLSAYKVDIRNKRSHMAWNNCLGSETDGYSELLNYFSDRNNRIVCLGDSSAGTHTDNRAIKLTNFANDERRRLIAGQMLRGEAGLIQQIYDISSGGTNPTYETSKNEGILAPLYFRFHIPDGLDYGVAILQTFGPEGLKGYIQDDFRNYFGDLPSPITVKLTQLVDRRALLEYADQGLLKDIILVNAGLTKESRDVMKHSTVGGDSLGDPGDKMTLKLHKQSGWLKKVLEQITSMLKDNGQMRQMINIGGMNINSFDDIKAEIQKGARRQVFSIIHPENNPIRYDISDKVKIGSEGYPLWDDIHAVADEIWGQVRELIQA